MILKPPRASVLVRRWAGLVIALSGFRGATGNAWAACRLAGERVVLGLGFSFGFGFAVALADFTGLTLAGLSGTVSV